MTNKLKVLLTTLLLTSSVTLNAKEIAILTSPNTIDGSVTTQVINHPSFRYSDIDIFQGDKNLGSYTREEVSKSIDVVIDTKSKTSNLRVIPKNYTIDNSGAELFIGSNLPYYTTEGTEIIWKLLFTGLSSVSEFTWDIESYDLDSNFIEQRQYKNINPPTLLNKGTHIVNLRYNDGIGNEFTATKKIKIEPKVEYIAKINIPKLNIYEGTNIEWKYIFNGMVKSVKWYIDDMVQDKLPDTLPIGSYKIKIEILNELGDTYTDSVDLIVAKIEDVKVKDIVGSSRYAYAIMTDGTIRAWGANEYGQLGTGDNKFYNTPKEIVGLNGAVKKLVAGKEFSTIALMEDGRLMGWGGNLGRELGLGDSTMRVSPTELWWFRDKVDDVIMGCSGSMLVLKDGRIMSSGRDSYGELGTGSTEYTTVFNAIEGLSTNAKQVIYNDNIAFAIMKDGTVKAWGNNIYGQLGLGHNNSVKIPTTVSALGTEVDRIIYYKDSIFAIMKDGTAKAWGRNSYGELGLGDTTNRNTPVDVNIPGNNIKNIYCNEYSTIFLTNDNKIFTTGDNSSGQLGLNDTTQRLAPTEVPNIDFDIRDIYLSRYGSVHIVTEDGKLVSFGENSNGELGLGSNTNVLTPTLHNNIDSIIKFSYCDYGSFFAIDSNSNIYSFGLNSNGQLGVGNFDDTSEPIKLSIK